MKTSPKKKQSASLEYLLSITRIVGDHAGINVVRMVQFKNVMDEI
jgi:hypothetical protein